MLDLERNRRFRQAKENLISPPLTPITFTDLFNPYHGLWIPASKCAKPVPVDSSAEVLQNVLSARPIAVFMSSFQLYL
ncbi:hypothetical protein TYRP_020141 [Tyrophagus putrescentiae]|nr:hypothetical protein TYRP_020141 [Tyrophagus putrescentiae]